MSNDSLDLFRPRLAYARNSCALTSFARRRIIFFHGRAAAFAVNSDTNENIIRFLMLARLPYRREENHVCKYPPIRSRESSQALRWDRVTRATGLKLVLYHYVVAQLYATRLGIIYEIVLKNIYTNLERNVKYKV